VECEVNLNLISWLSILYLNSNRHFPYVPPDFLHELKAFYTIFNCELKFTLHHFESKAISTIFGINLNSTKYTNPSF